MPSLAWRVLVLNSLVVVLAATVLAFGPTTISSPVRVRELGGLAAGLAIVLALNALLVRRAFAPLERLAATMRAVDPLTPGTRLEVTGPGDDVRVLAEAFNDMLGRLEDERRDSARRAVLAQERERRRLSHELHDELGQALTGVLLQIDAAARAPSADGLAQARETTRRSLDDLRRIARDLRPDTLEELGLVSGLNALATRFTRQAGIAVDRRLPPELPPLTEEAELVLYRVAQESLTNVARHAGARRVALRLSATLDRAVLTVEDDGRGLPAGAGSEGRGITGMRERALLVRGRLTLSPGGGGTGTRVELSVPAGTRP